VDTSTHFLDMFGTYYKIALSNFQYQTFGFASQNELIQITGFTTRNGGLLSNTLSLKILGPNTCPSATLNMCNKLNVALCSTQLLENA
jgi:hypothetical protein